MNVAFDASPLVGDLISGVGWCEANLTAALTRLHPELSYRFEYFTMREPEEKVRRMQPFLQENTPLHPARFSPLAYRMMTNIVPVPYRMFQGKWADITHFFNYIVPPGVHGKTVVTIHDMVIRAYPETMRCRTRLLLQTGLRRSMHRADRIVTDSEFSRREIEKYYPKYADKVRVVPCGVDTERFAPASDTEIEKVRQRHHLPEQYFLYLGTLEPRKNLVRLIEAYGLLREKHPDAPPLVLAGGKGWQYEQIFHASTRKNVRGYVLFPSYIPAEDMAALYSGALAFIFPSLYEGFGMPPLEAMACGCPVMAANAASLPEAVGNAALLCNPHKTEAIAKGLEMLWKNGSLCEKLRQRGFIRAAAMSWDNAAEKLFQVYREIGTE
ncbi:MAG: glycosyltransferase family 4 protein [Oscillospiraceae bacterium]|nr:glycosyltransferase family 4 protein [Oscillospiraceae bacterium]